MVLLRKEMIVLLLLFLVVGNTELCAQQPALSIEAVLDRDTIGMDEQAVLQVVVSGTSQNLPNPTMPTLPMFEVYSQGRSSNLSITNGVVKSSVIYRYLLLPQKAGTFPIDNIAVVHNNKRYKAEKIDLTVLQRGSSAGQSTEQNALDSGGDARDYFLEATVDKKKPYVSEQVTLTLKFYVAPRVYGSPDLAAPSVTGFWAEYMGNKGVYQQTINGRTYRVYELKYALFPTQTGALSIGRATIQATIADNRRSRDPFDNFFGGAFGGGREITVRSQPIKIDVRPLPDNGKPGNFTGSVGRFSIAASPNRTTVGVNQPISLSVKITGEGNIKSVAEPVIPELAEFRVYQESTNESISKLNDRIGGTKEYEEVFIPRRPGRSEIPALEFNFFDPSTRKYQTVKTKPIPITVTKPEGYVESDDLPYSRPELAVGAEAQDIRYIKTETDDFRRKGDILLTSPLYIGVNAAPVLVMFGLIAFRVRREKLSSDTGYARARGASREARRRLARARSLARRDTSEEFFLEISMALTSYVADKLNVSAHGLTTERIEGLLVDRQAESSLIDDIKTLIRQADYARFAPSQIDDTAIAKALSEAEQVMTRMEGLL